MRVEIHHIHFIGKIVVLGSQLDADGSPKDALVSRAQAAIAAFHINKNQLRSRSLSWKLRLRLMRSLIMPVLTWGLSCQNLSLRDLRFIDQTYRSLVTQAFRWKSDDADEGWLEWYVRTQRKARRLLNRATRPGPWDDPALWRPSKPSGVVLREQWRGIQRVAIGLPGRLLRYRENWSATSRALRVRHSRSGPRRRLMDPIKNFLRTNQREWAIAYVEPWWNDHVEQFIRFASPTPSGRSDLGTLRASNVLRLLRDDHV